MPRNLEHIILSGYVTTESYTSPNTGRDRVIATGRNRNTHGNVLRNQLSNAIASFRHEVEADLVYLEFISEEDCLLAFDSFEDGRKGDHRFVSSKLEKYTIDGVEHKRYRACVYLNKKGISKFLNKIEVYLDTEKDSPSGNPRNSKLLNNIAVIQRATLISFWQEDEINFPEQDEIVWWEVWLRRDIVENDSFEDQDVVDMLVRNTIEVAERRLLFPEHIVRLIRCSARQLSKTILYSDRLAELRKPKEIADYFTGLDGNDANDWVKELKNRTVNRTTDDSVVVCLLDTGVNRGHPLLQDFLPEKNMDSVKPEWGNSDNDRHGHGTPMAGTALYGDLTDLLQEFSNIEIFYRLESVKLIHPNNPHHPELYGAVTEEAVARATILNPKNKRVITMAVTATDGRDKGKPSSWSSSVDKIAFGEQGISNDKTLFCVSGGNTKIHYPSEYPRSNLEESIHDPAQAFNALSVGSYTKKTIIDQEQFSGATPLVHAGGMAPSNSTSLMWENSWPLKPELVMEGGNYGIHNGGIIDPDSLRLLSIGKNFRTEPLHSFGDTSGATALASRYAAMLTSQYPTLWPETIKGLLVHSADWTSEMLCKRSIQDLNNIEQRNLLRTFGYGVPNYQKAVHSANNSLTLISQEQLKPFVLDGNTVKTNDMHLHNLPWPTEVLTALFDTEVTLTATLSYFIEPNPGNKQYSKSYYYQSHGLRLKMIDSGESIEQFRERVNREARSEVESSSYSGENWIIGNKVRDKGSIHKDIWKGTAADLATRNVVAIFPVNGWWRTRKKLMRYNNDVRYSLILSIESQNNDVDLYNAIINKIDILI
ncbi:S8 family peptidase [Leeuwenhoekiella polynyae]|uniref:Subtilase family protein n=1 Tax=Leeuwenhoekiella polynyae TaxID=1550906 RepID=A0A4Q0P0Q3_9FLAO|nr:S8 family peptidase [Leeuwenhoekiella polynyae]RXG20053.1 subtilase family protein [Leeuwenhoekiella polynyae]